VHRRAFFAASGVPGSHGRPVPQAGTPLAEERVCAQWLRAQARTVFADRRKTSQWKTKKGAPVPGADLPE